MSHKRARVWPVYLLALPAFVSVWSGWVELGEMVGFGVVQPLPGIADVEINTAITLPIGVETYAAYALHVWLSNTAASAQARRFAKLSAIGSLVFAAAGQIAYHQLAAEGAVRAPRPVIVLVSCLPVLVLGMGAALAHLVRAGEPAPAATSPAAGQPAPLLDPKVAELCGEVRGQALAARSRVMLSPTVAVGHLGSGRPPVHLLAAKAASDPANTTATSPPVEPPAGAPEVAEEVAADGDPAPATPRPPRGQEAAKRVAKIVARKPDVTAPEVAKRLGIPERTAARHLSRVRAGEHMSDR